MSVILKLLIVDCFYNYWKSYGGVGWACNEKSSSKATIVMTHDTSSTCAGTNERHELRVGEFAYFDNNTWKVVLNQIGDSSIRIEIFEVEEEPDPEPEETDVQTARINNFSITGHSPYMVGSMINFEVDVEWLADTRLCIAVTPAYTSNNTWYSCGPTCGKDSNEETKGTKIRYKGAFTVSADMLKHTNQQLAVYFIVTDNNSYIEQDYKFIPIQVIEPTYPDDDPIWDDPDPIDPDPIDPVDPDDPDVIPEIDNNIWFYVTIILFIGLIGVMIWSSR